VSLAAPAGYGRGGRMKIETDKATSCRVHHGTRSFPDRRFAREHGLENWQDRCRLRPAILRNIRQ